MHQMLLWRTKRSIQVRQGRWLCCKIDLHNGKLYSYWTNLSSYFLLFLNVVRWSGRSGWLIKATPFINSASLQEAIVPNLLLDKPCLCVGSSQHKNPAAQLGLALPSLAALSQAMDSILACLRGAQTLSCQVSGHSKIWQGGKCVHPKHLRQLNLCSRTSPAASHAMLIKRKV